MLLLGLAATGSNIRTAVAATIEPRPGQHLEQKPLESAIDRTPSCSNLAAALVEREVAGVYGILHTVGCSAVAQ